jgi:anhydro-N-acetylmuramic acid kinase
VDKDGALAAAGRVDDGVLAALMADPYFARRPPKSLDRNHFRNAANRVGALSAEDGAATLTAFTAAAVADASEHLPVQVTEWLVTGGGRRNPVLMGALGTRLAAPVRAIEAIGWNGDAIEAQGLRVYGGTEPQRSADQLPRDQRVPEPMTGGRLHKPN